MPAVAHQHLHWPKNMGIIEVKGQGQALETPYFNYLLNRNSGRQCQRWAVGETPSVAQNSLGITGSSCFVVSGCSKGEWTVRSRCPNVEP